MIQFPLLSIIIFLPLFGGLLALAFRDRPQLCRWTSLAATLSDLLLVLGLIVFGHLWRHEAAGPWLLLEDFPWIESLGARYSLGLDGISLMLVLLTAFLGVLSVLVSWKQIETRVGAFHFFLLSMQTGVLGVFLATDLLLFYLFWEIQLIPMFFIIGVWGHEGRIHAAIKFILFTITGSLLMLVAIIGLYLIHGAKTGTYSFSLFQLMQTPLSSAAEIWLYAAFLLAFAIKIPVIPVHTWLPDAHTEAPTAGSVILAGVLLKTGAYALLRFAFSLFPRAAGISEPLLLVLGLGGVFYAAWIALAQSDMKRMVAYSSVAHMGLILIGMALGTLMTLTGAVLQMVNHGLTTSALFIMVGILEERTHSRELAQCGGLWRKMPVYSGFFLLFAMSSLGLPGLNNFVGEILILVGAFIVKPPVAVLGFAGLVLTLIYILRLVQDALFGEARKEHILWDLTPRELVILAPLAAAVLFIGLSPGPILDLLNEPVQGFIQQAVKMLPASTM